MRILSILLVLVLTGCADSAARPGSDADVTFQDGSVNPDGSVDVDSSVPDGGSPMGCLATDTDTGTLTLHAPWRMGGQINLDGEGTLACGQPDFTDGTSLVVDNGFYNTSLQSLYPELQKLSGAFAGTNPGSPSSIGHGHIVITLTHMLPANGDTQIDDPCVGVEIHTYSAQNEVGTVNTTGSMIGGRMTLHVDAVSMELPLTDLVLMNLSPYCEFGCTPTAMHMTIADVTLNLGTNTASGVTTFVEAEMGGYIVDPVAMYQELRTALRTGVSAEQRIPALYDLVVQNGNIVPCNSTPPNALSIVIMTW